MKIKLNQCRRLGPFSVSAVYDLGQQINVVALAVTEGECDNHQKLGVIAGKLLTYQCVAARNCKQTDQCSIQPVWRSPESGEG